MSKWLSDDLRIIYGVGLYREVAPAGCPNIALKLGQTSSTNPLDRIRYRGADEPYPITDAFEKQCNVDFIICPKKDANWLEWVFMDVIKESGRPFHDRDVWEEPVNSIGAILCGITEMCPWNEDKVCLLLSLFEAYKEGRIKKK